MTEQKTSHYKDSESYTLGVDDCWVYLYYELGMKDLAEEMRDWHNRIVNES